MESLSVGTTSCVRQIPYGLVVRITGFHPVGPGSIPGMGAYIFKLKSNELSTSYLKANSPSAVPYCLVVRISGSHPEGPGSIPGMGTFNFCHFFPMVEKYLKNINTDTTQARTGDLLRVRQM